VRSFVPKVVQNQVDAGQAQHIGEFRNATVLMLKLYGIEYHKDNTFPQVRQAVACVQEHVQKYDGTVMRIIHDDKGTRLLIAFGLPSQSHEDDETRTVLSSLEMQMVLRGLGLKPAFGIATGHVFVGRSGSFTRCEYTTSGADVIMAARLMDAAKDAILVDEATYKPASSGVVFADPIQIKVKNRKEPVSVYRANARKEKNEKEATKDVKMFGRAIEIEMVRSVVMRTKNGANMGGTDSYELQANPLLFVGEAGFGKTMLFSLLQQQCAEHGVTCLALKSDEFESSGSSSGVLSSLTKHVLKLPSCVEISSDIETLLAYFHNNSAVANTTKHVGGAHTSRQSVMIGATVAGRADARGSVVGGLGLGPTALKGLPPTLEEKDAPQMPLARRSSIQMIATKFGNLGVSTPKSAKGAAPRMSWKGPAEKLELLDARAADDTHLLALVSLVWCEDVVQRSVPAARKAGDGTPHAPHGSSHRYSVHNKVDVSSVRPEFGPSSSMKFDAVGNESPAKNQLQPQISKNRRLSVANFVSGATSLFNKTGLASSQRVAPSPTPHHHVDTNFNGADAALGTPASSKPRPAGEHPIVEEEEEEEGEEQAKEDEGSKDKDSDAELVRKLSAMPLDVPVGWERSLTTEIGEGRLEGYLLIEEEIPAVTMLFPLRASSCVFGGFSNDELIALLSTFEAKTVKAGEHLIKFGEPVNRMYVLKKGRCVCLNKVS
jgi:class 3 adenylate cyclase